MPRGKGKKEAMVHVNLRLPIHVLAYFQQLPNYTVEMRKVLEGYVKQQDRDESQQGRLMMIDTLREELTNRNEKAKDWYAKNEGGNKNGI